VHGGKSPTYLEYFNGEKDVTVLVDQLQSEQGARFLHKRNRNIIVEVDENEEADTEETEDVDPDAGKSEQQVIDEMTGQLSLFPDEE
jgi:hypothetical protein